MCVATYADIVVTTVWAIPILTTVQRMCDIRFMTYQSFEVCRPHAHMHVYTFY